MAATDYIICEGCLGTIYLAKKTKPRKNGPQLMSQDRRTHKIITYLKLSKITQSTE